MEHAAGRFAEDHSRTHGPDSVAFYISGQLLTEDYYAFNKLARALVGTNNIDSNSRLCMSSAVVGYKRSTGRRRTAVQLRRPRLRRLRADRRQQHGLRPPGPVPSPGSRQGRSARRCASW
ncbi:molybdopterin-dependent oxidoreductase [Pseudomonas aeruginosa]|nr:molybdopterin-dependent oxidoreductase [Pseudomonas aeruginosa]